MRPNQGRNRSEPREQQRGQGQHSQTQPPSQSQHSQTQPPGQGQQPQTQPPGGGRQSQTNPSGQGRQPSAAPRTRGQPPAGQEASAGQGGPGQQPQGTGTPGTAGHPPQAGPPAGQPAQTPRQGTQQAPGPAGETSTPPTQTPAAQSQGATGVGPDVQAGGATPPGQQMQPSQQLQPGPQLQSGQQMQPSQQVQPGQAMAPGRPERMGRPLETITVDRIVQTDVVTVEPETPIATAVAQMAEQNVGSVVVVADDRPIGILTDRSICLALESDPDVTEKTASDLVSGDLTTGTMEESVFDVIRRLEESGIRRLPIVDDGGTLQGIVTLDDLLVLLDGELHKAIEVIREQSPRI